MPGMNSGLDVNDPTVVAAFRSALSHQGIIALLIIAVLSVAWVSVRSPASAAGPAGEPAVGPAWSPDPAGRRLLRIGFGLLWLLDGLLQAQPGMAVGLPSQVIEPSAVSSPAWARHLVNWAGTIWSYHPVQVGAAVVWIQLGIGIWLLAAPAGALSRVAGAVSAAWALIVWVFGESFGGIFAPGLTWLFGAPGAALLYCVAGLAVALPARSWRTPRLGRVVLGGMGVFLIGMAVLQAWPGRGFWQGTSGTLAGMVQSMAQTSQPRVLAALVSGFGSLVGAHGFAVNLVAVAVLALAGLGFLTGRRPVVRITLVVFIVVCLADWVLIEDLGVFGGLGTDPNSMIPLILLAGAGYLALTRVPEPVPAAQDPAPDPEASAARDRPVRPGPGWRTRLRPSALRGSLAAASFGTMASACAIGVIALGAAPMALAQATPNASAILAQAIDGPVNAIAGPAAGFTLTDQRGREVSLADLRGKVVLLTFLDPVCVSECPLIAQEFRQAGQLLGADARRVELVAVNVNPLYNELSYTQAFDRQEGLAGVPDWLYLTGSPQVLRQVYREYGVTSQTLPAGAMLGHSDIAFVIDRAGQLRAELDLDPGPGTVATQSSFATELVTAARQQLAL